MERPQGGQESLLHHFNDQKPRGKGRNIGVFRRGEREEMPGNKARSASGGDKKLGGMAVGEVGKERRTKMRKERHEGKERVKEEESGKEGRADDR